MAQRAIDRELSEQIDWCLTYLLNQWSAVAEEAEHWPEMDSVEQEVFHLEWAGITEHWLRELRQWAQAGYLSHGQLRRYHQLDEFVREQRPTLRAMLGEETTLIPTIIENVDR